MLKHQVLIAFICILIGVWIALTLRERRKTRDNDENNSSENE